MSNGDGWDGDRCPGGVRNCSLCWRASAKVKNEVVYQMEDGSRVAAKDGVFWRVGKDNVPLKRLKDHLSEKLIPVGMIREKAKSLRERLFAGNG